MDYRKVDERKADDSSGVELKATPSEDRNAIIKFDVLKHAQTDVLEAAEFAKQHTVQTIKYYKHYVDTVLLHQMSESMWINLENIATLFPFWLRALAVIEFYIWLAICVYFAYTAYKQGANQKFVSMSSDAGICEPVPRHVDLQQFISIDTGNRTNNRGIWSSNAKYQANSTAYEMQLSNFVATPSEFVSALRTTETVLQQIAYTGINRGLPWNINVWTTFTHTVYSQSSGTYEFSLLGDVKTVYNTPEVYAQIMGRDHGMCEMEATSAKFDYASSSFVLTVKDYFRDGYIGKCPNHINTTGFGVPPNSVNKYYQDLELLFDMESMSIALAVNMGQIPITELSRVKLTGAKVNFPYEFCTANPQDCFGLQVVDWAAFTSVRYAGMDPLNCVGAIESSGETRYFCFVRLGRMILYPIINHYELCECDTVENNDALASLCNQQNIMPGVIFYPHETVDDFPRTLNAISYLRFAFFQNPYADNYMNNATWPASRLGISGAYGVNVTHQQVYDSLKGLCVSVSSCTIIVFQSKKTDDHSINRFALQMPNVACSESIYCSECIDELVGSYPFSLTEDYLSCTQKPFDNFILAVGISTGNASIFTQFILFVVTAILGQYLRFWYQYKTGFGDGDGDTETARRLEERKQVKSEKLHGKNTSSKDISSSSKSAVHCVDQPEIQHETDEIIEKVNKVGFLDLPDDVSPTETYQKLRKSVSALQDVVTHQNNILIRMRRVCIDEYEDIQRLNSMIIALKGRTDKLVGNDSRHRFTPAQTQDMKAYLEAMLKDTSSINGSERV